MMKRAARRSFNPGQMSRRGALVMAGGAFLAALPPLAGSSAVRKNAWRDSAKVRALVGEDTPDREGIALELPRVSENSESVPLGLYVKTPEDAADFVDRVHVIAPDNPFPEVAVFHFTPRVGRVEIATRIRLDRSQAVIAVARMRSGQLRLAEAHVRIASTGCYLPSRGDWSKAMQTRIRVPTFAPGIPGEVVTLIKHPMDNGLGTDNAMGTEASDEEVKQRIIERFEARLDDDVVLAASFGPSIAADPYLRFYIAPQAPAALWLQWTEDTGRQASERIKVKVNA